MTVIFPCAALVIFALFFLYTGIVSFLQPTGFARSLSLEAIGRSGSVEIRAQYGGFFFAAALSQASPLLGLISVSTALIVALVIFGGLIVGRIGGLFFRAEGQKITPMIRNLFWIDAAGTLIAAAGLLTTQQGPYS